MDKNNAVKNAHTLHTAFQLCCTKGGTIHCCTVQPYVHMSLNVSSYKDTNDAIEDHSCIVIYEMLLVEQDATVINQMQDVFNPKVFVNCLQEVVVSCSTSDIS